MPTYTATFRTDGEYATICVEAKSAKQALRQAEEIWEQNQSALTFQRYDEIQPLNEIEIADQSGNSRAIWLDEDMHLRLAAEDMRSALSMALEALKESPKPADKKWLIRECERVLAESFDER